MKFIGKATIGHLAALSAYLIFGFNIIMTKGLTNAHIFTPLSLFTLRALGAGALFWLLSLFTKREKVERRDYVQIFFASLLGYFGTQITFLVGINYATPLDCAIISTFQPVLTMLVAAYVLKEPITLKKAGGVGISLAGIIVLIMSSAASMADPSRLTTPFGLVMLIANSLCFAAYLGIFKPLIQRYTVVTFMKWIFFFSFVLSAPFSAADIALVDYAAVPLKCYVELGYLIFMATFVAYFLIPVGQKHLRPTIVGLYSYVQPVIASALGIWLGMDRLTTAKIVAIVAVVAGVVMVNRSKAKQQNETNNIHMKKTLILFAASLFLTGSAAVAQETFHVENSTTQFANGQKWLDTDGRHINAHGGNIICHNGTFYWYGENRPDHGFTTEVGVSVYSSRDLEHWKNEGVALAVSEQPGHDIERGCIMERPKVVYNKKTKKFVMLFHLELKGRGYEAARVAFAESDKPTGPFRFIRSQRINAGIWPFDMSKKQRNAAKKTNAADWKEWWTPEWRAETEKGMYLWRDFEGGQMSRDMTVYVDEQGTAYHITSSQENLTLLVCELTDDYLGYTGKYNMIAPGGQNEAPCLFKHAGRFWLICSGCTGWAPNEARMFTSESIWGPWKQLPTPFTGEGANKTFGGQGTYIMNVNGRNIFMADVWNPRHLSQSLHLWLPIDFDANGTPVIPWRENYLNHD